MPKVIKKRVSKKSGDTEMEVQEKISSLKSTLKERKAAALKIGVGIVIIIVVVAGFLVYSSNSRKKAETLESEAGKLYYGNPQADAAKKEEQYKKALDLFKKAYAAKNSPLPLFYVAACYYELGKYDDALKTLKDFTQKYPNDSSFSPLVYQKMALTYIKKGDIKEAEKTLDTLYSLRGDIFKDFALIEYARLLEKEGKMEEAKKKYQELVSKYPNSPFKDEANAKLAGKKEG